MKVRLLRTFGPYKSGKVFDWADGFARIIVSRGLAVAADEPEVEAATMVRREERATAQPQIKRRMK